MIFRVSFLFYLCFTFLHIIKTAHCRQVYQSDASSYDEEQAWKEFKEFREWRKLRNENWDRKAGNKIEEELNWSRYPDVDDKKILSTIMKNNHKTKSVDPPPVDQPALMGRFIVNQADWTAVATISTRKDIFSFPIANVISVSDGPLGNGSGIPYMYLTPLDFTAQDLANDDRATLLMTLAQGSYCKGQGMDPMDPRCARILLAGNIQKIDKFSSEFEVARNAVFGRHPWLANMPEDHHFFFAKLNINSIAVLDTFGGPKYVSVEDYMNPPQLKSHRKHDRFPFNIWPEKNLSFESEERFAYRV